MVFHLSLACHAIEPQPRCKRAANAQRFSIGRTPRKARLEFALNRKATNLSFFESFSRAYLLALQGRNVAKNLRYAVSFHLFLSEMQ